MTKRIVFGAFLAIALFLMPGASQARWMNTNTGRFHTMDTDEGDQEDPKSLHHYAYAQNDPVNNIDPSGNDIGDMLAVVDIGDTLDMFSSPAAIVSAERATVDVHFDQLGSVFGKKYHHAYLLLHGPVGLPYIFRGGPSGDGGAWGAVSDATGTVGKGKDLGYGYLTEEGSGELFTSSSVDYPKKPTDDVAHVSVPVGAKSFSELFQGFKRAADMIEGLRMPYHPVRQNSNSFADTLLIKNNLLTPKTPVWAPGWDHILY